VNRVFVSAMACAVALLLSSMSRAEDAAAAAQHFDTGTALYKASRFAEARAEFLQAWNARHSYDIAANLGDCEVEVGQFKDAAEHLAYALKELPISAKEGVRQRLQTRFGLARAEVSTVRVHVTPPQATVIVNGREFAPVPEEVFLDPGPATVEAHLPGYSAAKVSTPPIPKGAAQDVNLTLTALPTQVIEGDGSKKNVPLILVGAGVTAAGLVTGLAFTLVGSSKASSAAAALTKIEASHPGSSSPCSAPADPRCASLKTLNSDADTMNNVGRVAFIATGVAAAATLTYILWPTSKPIEPAATGLRITPVFGPKSGGAFLRASF
jgi:tetratricopeptide (TPR) repeat protein